MLDEMLGSLDDMLGRSLSKHSWHCGYVLPLKKSRAICILIVIPSLKRTAPSQRIQIITSIEMLEEMLDDLLVI